LLLYLRYRRKDWQRLAYRPAPAVTDLPDPETQA